MCLRVCVLHIHRMYCSTGAGNSWTRPYFSWLMFPASYMTIYKPMTKLRGSPSHIALCILPWPRYLELIKLSAASSPLRWTESFLITSHWVTVLNRGEIDPIWNNPIQLWLREDRNSGVVRSECIWTMSRLLLILDKTFDLNRIEIRIRRYFWSLASILRLKWAVQRYLHVTLW